MAFHRCLTMLLFNGSGIVTCPQEEVEGDRYDKALACLEQHHTVSLFSFTDDKKGLLRLEHVVRFLR